MTLGDIGPSASTFAFGSSTSGLSPAASATLLFAESRYFACSSKAARAALLAALPSKSGSQTSICVSAPCAVSALDVDAVIGSMASWMASSWAL